MSTPDAQWYLIAYPNPAVPQARRVRRRQMSPQTDGETILNLLKEIFPDHVKDLKEAKLLKAPILTTADIKDASMSNTYKWIRENDDQSSEIEYQEPLELAFPTGPYEASRRMIDIVVVTPEKAMDFDGDVDGTLIHMKARSGLTKTMRLTCSPSDGVKSPSSIKATVMDPRGPRYGRPADRFGPPIPIFVPELAFLKFDLDNLSEFTPDSGAISFALQLVERGAGFFDDEKNRQATLGPIIEGLLGESGLWLAPIADGAAKPDGVWLEDPFAYLILEMKNEPGLGGDPFLQGIFVYSKVIGQEKYRPFLQQSNFPVVLLAIAGSRLVVSVAIFADSIYAEELLSLDLRLGPFGSENVFRVARVFLAIKKCMKRLRRLYGRLKASTTPSPGALWPNPTPDPPTDARDLWTTLEFFSKLDHTLGTPIDQTAIDEDNKRHGLYLARTRIEPDTPMVEVLVKFVPTYNELAHTTLASNDPPLAPTLHSCNRVIGGMYMVVTQYIRSPSLLTTPPASSRGAIERDITRALLLLHEKDLVFGDLWEGNVLYSQADGGRAFLVDFDRVGRDREGVYPAYFKHGADLGVDRGQLMKKIHDTRNLQELLIRISGKH